LISKYGNTILNLVSSDYLDFKPLAINWHIIYHN
jgi:hypothetical protein